MYIKSCVTAADTFASKIMVHLGAYPKDWLILEQEDWTLQEPGQEWNDIEALEGLWLSSKGQQRATGPPAQQESKQPHAAGTFDFVPCALCLPGKSQSVTHSTATITVPVFACGGLIDRKIVEAGVGLF